LFERNLITCSELLNAILNEVRASPGHELDLLSELADALAQHENADVRRAVALVLGYYQVPHGTEALSGALRDKDSQVRATAATSLGQIGDPRAVEPLCRALTDHELEVRLLAARALGAIGDARAVAPLRESLESQDPDFHREVAIALGKLKDAGAFEPLWAEIAKGHWSARERAIAALGALGDPRSVEPLEKALQLALRGLQEPPLRDDAYETLAAIAQALGEVGTAALEQLTTIVDKGTPESREVAVEALGRTKDRRAIVPLVAALADHTIDPEWSAMDAEVQWAAVEALASLGEAAVEPLCEALGNSDPGVRRRAGWALIKIGAPAVMPLCRLLQDASKSDVVRQEAAIALGKLQCQAAVDPLCATLENSSGLVHYAVGQGLLELVGNSMSTPQHGILSNPNFEKGSRERDLQVLVGGTWVATPWNSSSDRTIRFGADGLGNVFYGYGQIIYVKEQIRWDLSQMGLLRLTYDASPTTAGHRDLRYRLTAGELSGSRTLGDGTHLFNWTLELSGPPWPADVKFPWRTRVFYGKFTPATRIDRGDPRQSAFPLELKPGDELFIGPTTNKRMAYAHVGIQKGAFTCIDAPFYLEPTSPFDYGHGTTTVPPAARNIGMQFETNCWGVHRRPMFSIGAIDEEAGAMTLLIESDLVVLPREERDHALTAYND
jgi:HEAT repeat protein